MWRPPEQIKKYTEHELRVSLDKGEDLVVIAEDDQRHPLGYVRLAIRPDFLALGPRGYVADLVVSPAAEGQGVALALMTVAEKWAQTLKLGMLSLHVFAGNSRARHFYEKLGFQPEVVEYVKLINLDHHD